ncbi:MBL fold metallo-hydrolase [Acidobacterium sp. S8]|uniref:MBL fold metallo-hydrolase n=1 Tax=Acidobacterium sp. S8 TaxID=1641854 RepID=UPI0020B16B6E|nr:MBL fold metallo-hydrolase [Acidobacterium sp. S8]
MAQPRQSRPKFSFIFNLIARSAFHPMEGEQQKPVLTGSGELGVTFIGHSTFLVQLGGKNLIVDPVFANWLVVLHRLRKPGVAIKDLPAIDAVLLTHAHMDHLNLPSLRRIIRHTRNLTGKAPAAIVPSNVADLVKDLGFSSVTQLAWWESVQLSSIDITLTPARHWGARKMTDTHRGFGGYVLRSGPHSLYHSGDTGYFDGFREIGQRLKPQVALLPIGAYSPDSFRSVHTSPEDALMIFSDLGAQTMIPMHYGTFCLSAEPMDEPLPRLLSAAENEGIADHVLALHEGETKIFRQPKAPIRDEKTLTAPETA